MSGAKASGTGYRTALRHRDFRLLVIGLVVDQAGSWAYNVALAVYVYEQTHSAGWVGAATVARFVPALVFSPYGGVIAERYERTRVMVVTSLLAAAIMAALAATAALEGPVELSIGLSALTTMVLTTYTPATAAITPELVGESDLAAANALNSTVENTAVVVGPALGAGLLLLGGPAVAFLVNAGTFLFSALMVSRISTRSRPVDVTEGGNAGTLRQMRAGLREITGSSTAVLLVAYSLLASFVYGTDTVLFVVLSEFQLGTGPTGYGYLLAGLGVGGVAGAGLVNRLAASPRLGAIITVGMAVYCLPTAVLVWVHQPTVAFFLQGLRGAGTLIVDVLAITALQRSLPSNVIARVFGVFFALVVGAIALGAVITPPLLAALGLHPVLLIFGVGIPVAVLLAYPMLRRLDQTAVTQVARLAPRIALLEDLGIFAAAQRPVLERLAAAATEVTVPPGTVVVREGDAADALYVLSSGEVGVSARGQSSEPQPLRTLTAPSYFGEIGLIEQIPRTATVAAMQDCRLLRIEGADFLDSLSSSPASTSLLEGARSRLFRTHPSYQVKAGSPLAEATGA